MIQPLPKTHKHRPKLPTTTDQNHLFSLPGGTPDKDRLESVGSCRLVSSSIPCCGIDVEADVEADVRFARVGFECMFKKNTRQPFYLSAAVSTATYECSVHHALLRQINYLGEVGKQLQNSEYKVVWSLFHLRLPNKD